MAIVNSFEKRKEHECTYKCGGREFQIDYMLCRIRNWKKVMGYKRREPRIRWWKLKVKDFRDKFTNEVAYKLREELSLHWKTKIEGIRKVGKQVLGRRSRKRKEEKEKCWWKEKVQEAHIIDKEAFKKWNT